eukprot:TRINITY_DN2810_c0_g2_i6.p4 TRINITY_DN2810_c0_g2~~TRINITY_DN2810_c0_g2_i6.p4  ORF type:complete len:101 (+),score=0.04 TRINITY_DN2810_c0_g2_i6:177-479(+)
MPVPFVLVLVLDNLRDEGVDACQAVPRDTTSSRRDPKRRHGSRTVKLVEVFQDAPVAKRRERQLGGDSVAESMIGVEASVLGLGGTNLLLRRGAARHLEL